LAHFLDEFRDARGILDAFTRLACGIGDLDAASKHPLAHGLTLAIAAATLPRRAIRPTARSPAAVAREIGRERISQSNVRARAAG
jgi:hypothetical protein